MDAIKVKVGDRVILRPDFGTGDPIEVTVVSIGILKGKMVVDYTYEGKCRWAYFHQIDKIIN